MSLLGLNEDAAWALALPGSSLQVWRGMGENGGIAYLLLCKGSAPSFDLTCRSYKIQKDDYEKQDQEKKKKYDNL
jgi:hypothetical protein